jgi:hypothetical protein
VVFWAIRENTKSMPYVVKAISDRGPVTWLRCSARGIRSVSIRADAEIIETAEDEKAAIEEMPPAFAKAGLTFLVEEIDEEP